jgi:hypothetical protein
MTIGDVSLAGMFVLGVLLLFAPRFLLRVMGTEATLNSRFTTRTWSLIACRLTGLLIVVQVLRVCLVRMKD